MRWPEHAGFTKGAVYANFASKEDLFLAMLDARFAERLAELDDILSTEQDPDTQAREAAAGFIAAIESEPEWERLLLRVRRLRGSQRGLPGGARRSLPLDARAHRRAPGAACRAAWHRAAIPPAQVATMTFAMANGIALERMLEPEAVPDGMAPEMIATFFAGLRAR